MRQITPSPRLIPSWVTRNYHTLQTKLPPTELRTVQGNSRTRQPIELDTLLRIQVKGRRFATRLLCMFSAKMMCLKRSNVLSTQRSGHQITQPTQGNIVGRLAIQSLRQLHTLMLLMRLSMLLYVRRKDALSPEGSYHGGNYGGYGSGNVSNSSSEGVVFSSGPTSLKPILGFW
jgi:hypothetical protein